MADGEDSLPHSLVPLALPVSSVRSRAGHAAGFDFDAVATLIAVRVEDIDCVVEMLLHPERAVFIRNRVLRAHARNLVTTSRGLAARSAELRSVARKALARASLVSQPAYPSATPSH